MGPTKTALECKLKNYEGIRIARPIYIQRPLFLVYPRGTTQALIMALPSLLNICRVYCGLKNERTSIYIRSIYITFYYAEHGFVVVLEMANPSFQDLLGPRWPLDTTIHRVALASSEIPPPTKTRLPDSLSRTQPHTKCGRRQLVAAIIFDATVFTHSSGHLFVFDLLNIFLPDFSVPNLLEFSNEFSSIHHKFSVCQYALQIENDAERLNR